MVYLTSYNWPRNEQEIWNITRGNTDHIFGYLICIVIRMHGVVYNQ